MILFGHFLTPQGDGGVLRKHISRGVVPFKLLHLSSSLRSRMMGPKQSTGSGKIKKKKGKKREAPALVVTRANPFAM